MNEQDMSREEYVEMRRQQAVAFAKDMIQGRLALLEGVFEIAVPLNELRLDNDPDWVILKGVASEVDHLPIGRARSQWSPGALKEKDQEIRKSEAFYRENILKACQRIIDRLTQQPDGKLPDST